MWNVLTTWTPLSSWTNWQRTWRSSWQASPSCDFISQPSKQFNTDTYAFRHSSPTETPTQLLEVWAPPPHGKGRVHSEFQDWLKVGHQPERVSQEQCLVQKKAGWGLLITTLDCYKIKLRLWQWRWAVTWYLSSLVYPNCTQFPWSDLYHAGGQYWSERASGPSLPYTFCHLLILFISFTL